MHHVAFGVGFSASVYMELCVKNRLCIFVIFIIFSFYCILALNVKLM